MPETTQLIDKPAPTENQEPQNQNHNQTPPEPEINQEGLDSMTQEELQKFASTGEKPSRQRDEKGRYIKADKPAETATKTGKTETKTDNPPPPPPVKDGDWIEIDVDEGQKLRFKSEDDLRKSFVHAQRLIRNQKSSLDKFNAEKGQFGQAQQALEQSQAKINELTNYIASLQQNAAQITRGQQPTANPAFNALTRQTGQAPGLEAIYQDITALRNDLLAEKAQNEKIRTELTETITGLRQKETEAEVNRGVEDLYRDVKDLQKKHPEFATAEDFARLDDIVSTYGEEAAQAMMSPSDFAQYQKVMEVVGLLKNDSEGNFDLKRQNFQNLEEALLIHSHRSGTLGQAMVQAHKAGTQAYENALQRNAQSATTLPNSVSGSSQPTMGQIEMDEILSMDPAKLNSSPELKAKFEQALKTLGINTIPTS